MLKIMQNASVINQKIVVQRWKIGKTTRSGRMMVTSFHRVGSEITLSALTVKNKCVRNLFKKYILIQFQYLLSIIPKS